MFYTVLDKKLLSRMISSQSDIQQWVVVDSMSQTIYHACGWESKYINAALKSAKKTSIPLKPYEIDVALENLTRLRLIEAAPGGPAVRVTYRGWYDKAMRIHATVSAILQNILLPVIVAIGSSFLTTLIMQLITKHI